MELCTALYLKSCSLRIQKARLYVTQSNYIKVLIKKRYLHGNLDSHHLFDTCLRAILCYFILNFLNLEK